MTPLQLIRLALKTSGIEGIGQTPSAEDVSDVLTILNAMLGTWSRKRWLIYNLIDVSIVSTGAQSYTIGTGGNINTARPDRLEAAYVRLLPTTTQTVDVPLGIIESHEDYSTLAVKNISSFPFAVFYDSAFPLGSIYPWPVPASGKYEIHLILKNTLTQFTTLVEEIALPPEYVDALIWNLAARCRPLFGLPPEPSIIALATSSLNVIRGANSQIARLTMPAGMSGYTAGRWAGHGIAGWAAIS